ncbi:hypothetical protein WJX82_005398 [Trebouxia sp. C0006]
MLAVSADDLNNACSSKRFVGLVASRGPFRDAASLIDTCRNVWWHKAQVTDWLEAFAAHPRIGDLDSLKAKFTQFAKSSQTEQATAATASGDILQELKSYNEQYEIRFGHIFIVCASGKSASEMLELVKARCNNAPHVELLAAATEQMKITELRLHKLLASQQQQAASQSDASMAAERRAGLVFNHLMGGAPTMRSPITTHVLDTSMGRPAPGVPISLHKEWAESSGVWDCVASGQTNQDGRVGDLLAPSDLVLPGVYKMSFDMTSYMKDCKHLHPHFFPEQPFYPKVDVHFHISNSQTKQHFHVPLTWNPYGYSTYRGS